MKKLIKTCLITTFVCFFILFIKNQYSALLLTGSSYSMPALIADGTAKNLYIGSSMFRQGLDIHALEKTTADSYILAYNGNQPALEYYQLKHLLDQDVKIENLYVDMYVYSAWEAPELSDEKLLLEIGLSEKWELWNLLRQNKEINSFETFWRIFVNSNNELLLSWFINSPLINSQFYRGGTLTQTASAPATVLTKSSAPVIEPEMNSIQEYYLKELISLAKEHEINLTFIETPKYQTVANDASYLSAMETYASLLEEAQVSYILSENTAQQIESPCNVLCYTFDVTKPEYFMDRVHLSSVGRKAFTEQLSK